MSLPYFENALSGGYLQTPNDYFRDLQQAAIDNLFDCTSARYTVQEQDAIGASTYHDIDVWLDYIVGTTSSGVKQGADFTQLMFRDIEHPVFQGLYYIFDDNYHISYFYNRYDGLEKALAVRRCNNAMRIVDPENGSIFSIPCVIDYDMASPSQQVSSYIITPNNHAVVMVQGNKDTLRLFKLNTRYIFNGRPFKLLAYQNALLQDLSNQNPTLLYLDLYLDEIHDKDDIENGLAYNGEYIYNIQIDADNMELSNGVKGNLSATITLNGEEVKRNVLWASSNEDAVLINVAGGYTIIGSSGSSATITATLDGNPNVSSTITIQVVDSQVVKPLILINPAFNKIRQFESIDFSIEVMYGSTLLVPQNITLSLSETGQVLSNQYLTITQSGSRYIITANTVATTPQILYVSVQNASPDFQITAQFTLNVVSMLG
uniref:Head closure knob n=1 Tax=Siphoviridae sp. ct0Wl9 TaxID=2827763 RepID=A0A8S5T9K2_9CAUD|nr:MAG TPA: head closure knob [Siphoviridae sp. ct0Wl9]